MKKFIIINLLALIILPVSIKSEPVNNALFTTVLKKYISYGRVNYARLRYDTSFKRYLKQLQNSNPLQIKGYNNKLAYWINVYNAFTLKVVCDNYPITSINNLSRGGVKIWDKKFIILNRKTYSLNQVEHQIIRKYFKDPRIHFALVCAANSCPPLRREAYVGSKLNWQLQNQGWIFLNNRYKNSFNDALKVAKISKIFKWFKQDFGTSDKKVLLYISRFLPASIKNSIKRNTSSWRIEYRPYSWNLNK